MPSYRSLRKTGKTLRLFAPICRALLFLLGVALFLDKARSLLGTGFGMGERVVLGTLALSYLGGFGLAGVLVHRILDAVGDLIEVWLDQTQAAQQTVAVLENELVPAIDRLAAVLDRAPRDGPGSAPPPTKKAELSSAEMLDELRLAKRAGDADRVLDLRDQLIQCIPQDQQRSLDRELAGWFCRHAQKELRAGRAQMIVGALARAVETLSDEKEIRQLREALPMIRRSAGLCGYCGRPYRGERPRCPNCMASGAKNEDDA